MQINTIRIKRAIENLFPQITSTGGVRPDALKWHPNGLAVDVMIPGAGGLNDPTPPEGKALGDQIYQWVMANKDAFGVDYVMWQEKDHFNHLHINTTGGGFPTGGEQITLPDGTVVPGIDQILGTPTGGVAPTGSLVSPDIAAALRSVGIDPATFAPSGGNQPQGFDLGAMIRQKFEDAYKPENIQSYLEGLFQNIGSSLSGIGTSFLSGITGLDLSQVMGPLQEVGNHYLSDSGGSEGSISGGSALNDEVAANLLNAAAGKGGTSLGLAGGSVDPKGGAEQWRPIVRQILEQVAPQYGITNIKAWEDALVKQIDTESKGNPGARNPNDSNGKGGNQSVNGLLQFLPSTFDAHNVTGGDYMDPVAQIYAAIDYVISKYGMDASGAPKQIGRGHGYKQGGQIKGRGGMDSILARVSRGEFLANAKAVKYYGADTFAALNAMQVPKESLPGFNTGGWWNPILPAPAPAPPPSTPAGSPGPTPTAPPPPAPGTAGPGAPVPPPQSLGPSPLQTPGIGAGAGLRADSAPSTGGAPGPGATAPAPETSPLPEVADALSGIGGLANVGAGQGSAQPGASPSNVGDARGTLGEAPASQDHLNPGLRGGIEGAWNTIGSLAGSAAAAAVAAGVGAGSMGAAAPAAGPAASAASQLVSGGFQVAGKAASGAANILASLLVGTLTGGSTAQASGVPLLPQRQPMQTGVPQVVDQRQYHVTNLQEFQRLQQRHESQAVNPYIKTF